MEICYNILKIIAFTINFCYLCHLLETYLRGRDEYRLERLRIETKYKIMSERINRGALL